ncbi:hypothetical protein BSKO_06645 [Bryopsis sp. KO-2023]|nr:hypothetical protein BSKO_06645 [Bryopsis sp. KO-2023]
MGKERAAWQHSVKRKSKVRYVVLSVMLVVGLAYILFADIRVNDSVDDASYSRKLLKEAEEENRTPLDDYPPDLFSQKQRKRGAVILHFLGMMYMFLALAIVCDEFFVPALEVIIHSLKIKDDVAGATFMAAGGSAPELATSLIGVFTDSSVGFGTVVGSAVFNVLFVIGMCSLFSKEVLTLTWWPLTRDVTFYSIGLGVLAWEFSDEKIEFWEAIVLLAIYVAYVSFMAFNETVRKWVSNKLVAMGVIKPPENEEAEEALIKTAAGGFLRARTLWKVSIFSAMAHAEKQKLIIEREVGKTTFKSLGRAVLMDNRFQKLKQEAAAAGAVDAFKVKEKPKPKEGGPSDRKLDKNLSFQAKIVENALHPEERARQDHNEDLSEPLFDQESGTPTGIRPRGVDDNEPPADPPANGQNDPKSNMEEEEEEGLDLSFPKEFFPRVFYIISFPLLFALVFTIPDARKPQYKKWFPVSFLLSIMWIGVFSYLMVWWATTIGYTLGIPDVVMGLTFLAAGTSVPDLLTSVIVARQGQGDMAVSSSIGSNIFDICIGLPFPWLLYSIVNGGDAVVVKSDSLLYSVFVLFVMLIAVIVTIALSKWRMTKIMGFTMFGLYVLFLLQALLIEFEVIKL